MGVYGEGYQEIEEDSRRIKRAAFQRGRIHDALHVSALFFYVHYVSIMDLTSGLTS